MKCVITGGISSLSMNNDELIIEGNLVVSDTYHNFDELYAHRVILFNIITKQNKEISWKSRLHNDGTSFDGFFIAGMNLPEGSITYHIPDNLWDNFSGIEELEKAPEWDGHTSFDVIKRLATFAKEI